MRRFANLVFFRVFQEATKKPGGLPTAGLVAPRRMSVRAMTLKTQDIKRPQRRSLRKAS
jgi:hypothetical protein